MIRFLKTVIVKDAVYIEDVSSGVFKITHSAEVNKFENHILELIADATHNFIYNELIEFPMVSSTTTDTHRAYITVKEVIINNNEVKVIYDNILIVSKNYYVFNNTQTKILLDILEELTTMQGRCKANNHFKDRFDCNGNMLYYYMLGDYDRDKALNSKKINVIHELLNHHGSYSDVKSIGTYIKSKDTNLISWINTLTNLLEKEKYER